MTWPKWVVIVVALSGLYGSEFLYFLLPSVFGWLALVGDWFIILLFFYSIGALFKRRWKWIAIFAVVWVLLYFHELGVDAPHEWFNRQGFHIHTLLAPDYLSKCQLTKFVENGVEQTGGFCERFDRGVIYDYIMYDTTGEFVLPMSERTPEWKRAMSAFPAPLVEREFGAFHLFGNFYRVIS
jgi:hypothetical protein